MISNIAFTAVHQQLIYSVTVAFYNYAAAQARLATATQSLKNARDVQDVTEDRNKAASGRSPRSPRPARVTRRPIWLWYRRPGGHRTPISP